MLKRKKASIDLISGNGANFYGNAAKMLLNNDMNIGGLRTNATLQYDEWKEIDQTVLRVATQRNNLVNTMKRLGLVKTFNGMASTVLQWQQESDITAAEVSMNAVRKSAADRPEYSTKYMPLPIVHKDFQFDVRVLNESRKREISLDVATATMATRKVIEMQESIAASGSITYGGGTIYGFTTQPSRNTGSLHAQWTASSAVGASMVKDVIKMKQALENDKFYGPYVLVLPRGYSSLIDDDYKTYANQTIRQRILALDGITEVIIGDAMPANNVVLFQATNDVAEIVSGLEPTAVEWDTEGGMVMNFKVMAMELPRLRADENGNCGIAHYSA